MEEVRSRVNVIIGNKPSIFERKCTAINEGNQIRAGRGAESLPEVIKTKLTIRNFPESNDRIKQLRSLCASFRRPASNSSPSPADPRGSVCKRFQPRGRVSQEIL